MLAGALEPNYGKGPLDVRRHGCLDVRAQPSMHSDADLVEPHERTSADAVDDDRVDIVLGEHEHGGHAATLDVWRVVKDLDLAHLAVDYVDQSEALTAAEVAGATGLEAAG